MQTPAWQLSVRVHALLSLHAVPFAAAGFEHTPVAGLHVPATWHWSDAVHVTGVPAAQVPFWHVSAPLHRLLSAQLVPFATGVCVHAPLASQASAVHGFPSSQLPAADVHVPFWHVPVPHTLGDVQLVPLPAFMTTHPAVGSHDATWHGLELVHVSGVPGWHTPA